MFIARISRGRTIRQFVTGADSASIVMGGLSENGATDPSRFTVVFWGVATGGVASAMLLRHRWPTRSWSTRSPPRSRRPTSPMRSRPSSCTPGCRRPPATTMEMMRAPRTVPTRPPRT
nr:MULTISPECIES: BCCT family transporter [Actinomyces]